MKLRNGQYMIQWHTNHPDEDELNKIEAKGFVLVALNRINDYGNYKSVWRKT